jgi:PadR family transcriptional regulator PadR
VLSALAGQPSVWRHGYELGQEIDLKAGSLYPILMRLSDRGWLEASWETDPPAGRPPRHLYRLTGAGLQLAGQVVTEAAAPAEPGPRRRPRSRPDVATPRRATGPILRGAW